MRRSVVVGTFAVLISSALSATAARTFDAWGHTFTYADFRPESLDITLATEQQTGHKMNLIRLKNGHMMALVPADKYVALMSVPDEDMMK